MRCQIIILFYTIITIFFYRKFGLLFLTIPLNNKFNTMWRWTLTNLTPIKKTFTIPFWNSHELHAYKNNGNGGIIAPFITLKDPWITCCINLSIITLFWALHFLLNQQTILKLKKLRFSKRLRLEEYSFVFIKYKCTKTEVHVLFGHKM